MHKSLQALIDLLDFPSKEFDANIKKLEKIFQEIDVNEIRENEIMSLYTSAMEASRSEDLEKQKNAITLLAYIAGFEILIEKYFGEFVNVYKEVLEKDEKKLFSRAHAFLQNLEDILRVYSHRLSVPEECGPMTSIIQADAQKELIDLVFWLQDLEEADESQLDTESPDRTTEFGAVLAEDTKHPRLKATRKALELLGSGILEKILFDEGYSLKKSSKHDDLEIIGRFNTK